MLLLNAFNKMDGAVLVSVIAMLMTTHKSDGRLVQMPRDTTAKVNESTYFNCSTNLSARHIFWYHGTNIVSTGGVVYEGYKDRATVDEDMARGACNLVIQSVQPSDAGEYKCWEDEGTGEGFSAQLIVLDGDPICQSNVKLDDVMGENLCHLKRDDVELSCSVVYHGKGPPRLGWKTSEDGILGKGIIPSALPANTHRSTLKLGNHLSLHNSAYICQINGTEENQYNCTSGVIKLSYSVDSGEVVNAVRGTNLMCRANTTFDCKYRWFHENDSMCPVSCNQNVTANILGEYHCEAICFIRGKGCTFVAMHAFVTPESESAIAKIFGFPALVIIGVGSCLLGAIGVAIFLYLNPRKKPRNIDEALKFLEFSSEVLLQVGEKEKQAYYKKTGRDPSAQKFISDQMMQALKQVHSMFPPKDCPLGPLDGEGQIEHPIYCELIADERDNDDARTSIERTSVLSVYDNDRRLPSES